MLLVPAGPRWSREHTWRMGEIVHAQGNLVRFRMPPSHKSVLFFIIIKVIFNVYVFLRERERETEREWERCRERDRIRSRFQALNCQHRTDAGFEPMNCKIMT